ncbi:DUF455 family protein [Luteibacter sp. 9135]|uniref:DUF455 family protein n=1 Tax=Luteibacter sp. 9135 TaxID=1500893 RepID=UPI00055CD43A|nr:DUF455 family protein [Luteibacter sp. 9135]
MPEHTNPLIRAISGSGALCYVFVRALEFHACWLPRAASTELKLTLGQRIGKLGWALSLAHLRFTELTADTRLLAPTGLEEEFERLTMVEGDHAIHAASDQMTELLGAFLAASRERRLADHLETVLNGPSEVLEATLAAHFPKPSCPCPISMSGPIVIYALSLPVPATLASPRRAPDLEPRQGNEPTWASLIESPEGRAQILHDVFADIELSAMEVCAASIVRFRDLPIAFKVDMARQCWDEARHAQACLLRCDEIGRPAVGLRYSLKVWDRWMAGRDAIECLCIEQLVQEGNALDSVQALSRSFCAVGDFRSAHLLSMFGRDEELHTAIGNKWVTMAAKASPDRPYGARVRDAAERIGLTVPGHAPVAIDARRRGGFPETFLREITSARNLI